MTDRDAPVVLLEDHGYPLISTTAPGRLEGLREGYDLGRRTRRLTLATAIVAGCIIGSAVTLLWVNVVRAADATPRAAHAPSIPVADLGQLGAPPNGGRDADTAPSPSGDSASQGGAPRALSGTASWYPADGLIAAAGPRLRVGNWRGRLITFTAGGRAVRVRLADWCACPGRLVDLSDDAFRQLAPLSVGLVHVQVSGGLTTMSADPTPPATDQ